MDGWASALRHELNQREKGLGDAIGLSSKMSGQGFEKQLGALLRWRDLWPLNDQFRGLGGRQVGQVGKDLTEAHQLERARLEVIMAGINATLFSLFSAARIHEKKAASAYRKLLDAFDDPEDLMVVTTNYDPAAEVGLSGLGKDVKTGFDRPPGRPPPFNPRGMVKSARRDPGAVGVIHLHGAVGWYEREGVVYEQHQHEPFDPGRGRPVVLYPDPDKDPTRDALVQVLWDEFDEALADATHVLVLGHSLHDPALVGKLKAAALVSNVAICQRAMYTKSGAGWSGPIVDREESDRMLKLVPGVPSILPVHFGPRSGMSLAVIHEWVQRTNGPRSRKRR